MHNQSVSAPSILILAGCQRSGTTLLKTILSNHPLIEGHPYEPQFILELYQRFGKKISDVSTAVTYLCNHPYLPETISKKQLRHAYSTHQSLSIDAFFKIYLQVWQGEVVSPKILLLKDPAFIFQLNLICDLFPKATFIQIIRDPRGTIASQVTRWPQFSIWEASTIWKKAIFAGQKFFQTTKNPKYTIIFEKLLINPQKELETLCTYLNIPYSPEMLSFEENTVAYSQGGIPSQVKYTTVESKKLNKWQRTLSPIGIRLIESNCGTEMEQFGYTRLHPAVRKIPYGSQYLYQNIHTWVKVNGRRLKHQLRKIGWRLGIGLLKIPPKND